MRLETPPPASDISPQGSRFIEVFNAPRDPRVEREYLHWDKLRRLDPPPDLSSEEWWWKVKFERGIAMRVLDVTDVNGIRFSYGLPDFVLKSLHHVDQRCAGEVAMDEVVTSGPQAGRRFLVNSLMEEAIRSSQLEGATTSRVVAKELLRSGRQPKNRSERMIFNNYRALQFMREGMGDVLTVEALLELHRIVTEGTLRNPAAAGRFQLRDEPRVAVFDRDDRPPIHRPPPAGQLPERMQMLCDFANEGGGGSQFVHPVIRAILLHFWLAYDHPFEDGNGRAARILFFWLMRARGYWLVEYLPISRLLRSAPAQYAKAFLEVETDGADTTYFLIHQLRVIERSIDELHRYLRRKVTEIQEVEKLLQGGNGFNHRQLALLSDALRHPQRSYSFGQHAEIHRVTHETARSDLSALAQLDLLTRRRIGREYLFEPAPDLPTRLKESPL